MTIGLQEEQHARATIATGLRRVGYVVSLHGPYVHYGSGGRVHLVVRVDRGRKSSPPELVRISVDGLLFVQCLGTELEAVARWLPAFIVGEKGTSTLVPPFPLVGLLGDGSDSPTARSTVGARKAIAAHEERLAGIALRAKIRAATRTEAA
jgi:hypothetical protein